ncbi:class I SAM-dependent methyltransferase [Streptomyces sp. ME02-8801-2C]|uniref:class I SAM-dependent methyltransferase n=1 Tax=Streptomyces sp. ME02-8801-2C TaxID=3028680 RepID=UPI0029AFB7F6|nr:class I SAM-dependent methyltransferase [Streptomyces sp. ME02-8801-2C]MDX3454619.1 class I SAM-dependent methyltransferase [Streptomyces sp. ME02-8801-2C]
MSITHETTTGHAADATRDSAQHRIDSAPNSPAATSPDTAPRPWSADPYSQALHTGRGPLFLRRTDGWLLPLEVERWCARADEVDRQVLELCEGAVLDVGCGPGRLVAELAVQGRPVLGIDVSEAAVDHTLRLGGQALRRSVFEPLPGEGRWDTALLLDGNVGIGGDPAALLRRMAQLLAPGGLLIVETVTAGDAGDVGAAGGFGEAEEIVTAEEVDERVSVRLVDLTSDAHRTSGPSFPWARLGALPLLRHAAPAGWRPDGQWMSGGRSFVALRNRIRNTNSTAEPPNSTAVISSQRARNPSPDRPVEAS